MKTISKNADGTYKIVLYLKHDEYKQMKKLSSRLGLNDFETIKYAMKLVSWWSRGKIEPEG